MKVKLNISRTCALGFILLCFVGRIAPLQADTGGKAQGKKTKEATVDKVETKMPVEEVPPATETKTEATASGSPKAPEGGGIEEANRKEAGDLFFAGVLLFDQGKYAAALENFSKSYKLYSHWKTLYNIGMCYLEMNDLPHAASMLTKFLKGGVGKIKGDLIEEVAQTLKNLKAKLGVIKLTGHYEGAVLTVDGVENEDGTRGEEVFVTPGVHQIKLIRGKAILVDRKIAIEGGEVKEIFVLESAVADLPEETESVTQEAKGPTEEEKKRAEKIRQTKNSGWALLGISLAMLAAGGATGIVALVGKNDVEDLEARYRSEFDTSPKEELDRLKQERNEKFDQAMKFSIAATVFFCAAGATSFVSFLLLPLGYRRAAAEKKREASFYLTPVTAGMNLTF